MTENERLRIEIKKQLNSYRELCAERVQLLAEIRKLELLMASPGGPSLDGMPKGHGPGNPVERLAVKHLTLLDRYRTQEELLADAQLRIETTIERLEPTERRLARFRYIDGLAWDEVCEKMNYSWRQTHRIHARIIDKLLTAELERRTATNEN